MTARWRCMVYWNVHTAQSHLDHDCQEHQGPVNDLIYSPFSSSPRHRLDRGQGERTTAKYHAFTISYVFIRRDAWACCIYAMMITNFWLCCLLCVSHVVKLSVSPHDLSIHIAACCHAKMPALKQNKSLRRKDMFSAECSPPKAHPDPKMCWVVIRSQATPWGTRDRWSAQIST